MFVIGNDNIAALKLIPLLFQPISLKVNKKRKNCSDTPSTWRPSKVEQASAFIKFVVVSFVINLIISIKTKYCTFIILI